MRVGTALCIVTPVIFVKEMLSVDAAMKVISCSNSNLYVVIDGEVTFVSLSDVRGKTKEGMKEVIAAHVLSGAEIGGLAELEGSGFDKLNEGNLAYLRRMTVKLEYHLAVMFLMSLMSHM